MKNEKENHWKTHTETEKRNQWKIKTEINTPSDLDEEKNISKWW